jgi:alkanesulfonate monooxygenase
MLKFHWMLPKSGEVVVGVPQTAKAAARFRIESTNSDSPAARPEMNGWLAFAQCAENAGIESVLVALNRCEPDPVIISCALGRATTKLKFIAAYRSGLMQPTTFVQQINTLSGLIDGRIDLNIVAGSSTAEQYGYGDFLKHDERYARAEEFLAVCNAFWREDAEVNFHGKYYQVEGGKLNTPFMAPDRTAPEIYVSGHSESAERLACAQATCLLRVADTPEKLQPTIARARARGLRVCLRLGLICKPTRAEAVAAAEALLPENRDENTTRLKNDSQMYSEGAARAGSGHWLSPCLWTGLVPHYGPVWTTLLGSPDDLANAFLAYKKIGVSEFIISGWPELDEVVTFGEEVLPIVRDIERRLSADTESQTTRAAS